MCICVISSLGLLQIKLPGTFNCRSLISIFFISQMTSISKIFFIAESDLASVALLFLFCTEDYFGKFLLLLIFLFPLMLLLIVAPL